MNKFSCSQKNSVNQALLGVTLLNMKSDNNKDQGQAMFDKINCVCVGLTNLVFAFNNIGIPKFLSRTRIAKIVSISFLT